MRFDLANKKPALPLQWSSQPIGIRLDLFFQLFTLDLCNCLLQPIKRQLTIAPSPPAKEHLAKSINFGMSVLWSCGMTTVFE